MLSSAQPNASKETEFTITIYQVRTRPDGFPAGSHIYYAVISKQPTDTYIIEIYYLLSLVFNSLTANMYRSSFVTTSARIATNFTSIISIVSWFTANS